MVKILGIHFASSSQEIDPSALQEVKVAPECLQDVPHKNKN